MQEEEFIAILANHQGIIHKICHLYSKSEEERKDLFQEIAHVIGITESNVGVKLNRIKKKLKKLFNYA